MMIHEMNIYLSLVSFKMKPPLRNINPAQDKDRSDQGDHRDDFVDHDGGSDQRHQRDNIDIVGRAERTQLFDCRVPHDVTKH